MVRSYTRNDFRIKASISLVYDIEKVARNSIELRVATQVEWKIGPIELFCEVSDRNFFESARELMRH